MTKCEAGDSLDPTRIAVLRKLEEDGATGLVQELVSVFLNEVPERLGRIRNALAAKDRETIRREAHLLSSGAANLGAHSAHNFSKALEIWATAPEWSDPGTIISRLEIELARACRILPSMAGVKGAPG